MSATAPSYLQYAIQPGAAGVRDTLRAMAVLAKAGKKDRAVRDATLQCVARNLQKDYVAEARCVCDFVRDEVRYVRDILGVETLQLPRVTLETMQGDCDDKATLLASMLMSIGHPVRFVAIGPLPGQYNHVYAQTRIGNKWIACETTEPWPFGKEATKNVRARMFLHI